MTEQTHVSIDILSDIACELGESALWDDRARPLLLGRHHRASGSTRGTGRRRRPGRWPCRTRSAAWRCASGGGLVAALRHAIAFCDVDRGTVEIVRELETDLAGNRFNDGAVDPGGRFWFGSMDLAESTRPAPSTACDPDTHRSPGRSAASSAPTVRPGARTAARCTTSTRPGASIRAYDFDPVTGDGRRRRGSSSPTRRQAWFPDGVTVDAEGFIWNCKWAGGRHRAVRPRRDGRPGPHRCPVPRPTRCAFVGPDLSMLAVTSARVGLDAAELADAPLSGQVLLLDPGVRGLPAPRFAG